MATEFGYATGTFGATPSSNLKQTKSGKTNDFESADDIKNVFPFAGLQDSAKKPLTFSIDEGELPSGISLDSETGEISGTFDEVSSITDYTTKFKVVDANGDEAYEIAESDLPFAIFRPTYTWRIEPKDVRTILSTGAKTGDDEGNPRWFSLSLASSKEVMTLATACRKAATLLQQNLNFVKKGAEAAKTLLLLKANAIALILNAIADELEKLYNDLYNAGFYAITLTGQEGTTNSSERPTVMMTKEELLKREANASSYRRGLEWSGGGGQTLMDAAKLLESGFTSWALKNVDGYTISGGVAALPSRVKVEIDTDPFVSAFEWAGLPLQRQTPNQFLGKIQMKLQDKTDPGTPTFSSSASTAALIGLVGVPSAPQLNDFTVVLTSVLAFLGTTVVGSVETMLNTCKNLFKNNFISDVHVITLYGVRKYQYKSGLKQPHRNTKGVFKKGDIIMGERSGIALKVVATDEENDGYEELDLWTKPTTYNEYTNLDYTQDQKLAVEPAWTGGLVPFPAPIKLFFDTEPGELVTNAEDINFTNFEMDNNGHVTSEKVFKYQRRSARNTDGVIFAHKNRGGPKTDINPPVWNTYTLVEAFPAYGKFLGNILVFSNFLRSFAGTILDEVEKIIKFIDLIVEKMEEIVKSITDLLDFFESLKDIGMYGLIVQDPSGAGMLKGGTEALVNAIGNATGDDATPQIDPETLEPIWDEETHLPPGVDPLRIKPPETLKYTAGFCLVFGGPNSEIFWDNIKKVLPDV